MSNITTITDGSFGTSVLNADGPVLVDFWADWCRPCHAMAPIVDALADEYAGRLIVAKLDVEANPSTPDRYGIQGIPTLILFAGGKPVERTIGAQSMATLRRLLNPHVVTPAPTA